jgi:hypothetical protein
MPHSRHEVVLELGVGRETKNTYHFSRCDNGPRIFQYDLYVSILFASLTVQFYFIAVYTNTKHSEYMRMVYEAEICSEHTLLTIPVSL